MHVYYLSNYQADTSKSIISLWFFSIRIQDLKEFELCMVNTLQIILKTFVRAFMTVYVPEGWNALNVTLPLNACLVLSLMNTLVEA